MNALHSCSFETSLESALGGFDEYSERELDRMSEASARFCSVFNSCAGLLLLEDEPGVENGCSEVGFAAAGRAS